MTTTDIIDAIRNHPDQQVRIEGGRPGTEDYDAGYAYLDDDGNVQVNWDSGVRTALVMDETINLI